MKLILVRHAIAHDRDPARWPDDADRPLTERGTRRFQRVAARLDFVPRPQVLFSSPLRRAWQTAELLHLSGWPEPQAMPQLAPEAAAAQAARALRECREATVAMVGHEPALGLLAGWLLHGEKAGPAFEFRKGGLALLEVPQGARAGSATLRWLVTPRVVLGARR